MAIDTVRLRTESTDTESSVTESPDAGLPVTDATDTGPPRGIVDVSELPAGRVEAVVPAGPDREVHFERRAGRTFLVADD